MTSMSNLSNLNQNEFELGLAYDNNTTRVAKSREQHIWSNVMRTHIDLKICHFLPSILRVTEA